MSVIALVSGKLIKAPSTRIGQGGATYVTATIRAMTEAGDVLVGVIAFGTAAQTLAALGAGDALSASGRVKLTHWAGNDGQERHGLSMVADAVLTPYQVSVKKRGVATADRPREEATG